MFHRLRSQFVDQSVYLALLCGEKATLLMHEILSVLRREWITLHALPHVIGYYLRDVFGAGLMIDTRDSFDMSAGFRNMYNAFDTTSGSKAQNLAQVRQRDDATREITDEMAKEIPLGEEFVARAESSSRRKGGKLDASYGAGHIIYPPRSMEALPIDDSAFGLVCYERPDETSAQGFLDHEYWNGTYARGVSRGSRATARRRR
jgi:hypothetical protein